MFNDSNGVGPLSVARNLWDFVRPVVWIAGAILILGGLGAAGVGTDWIVAATLFWVLPVLVGYRLHVSKDRDAPLVLAIFLGWVGVLIALTLPAAGQKCPRCAETVRRDAAVCRYCGATLLEEGS